MKLCILFLLFSFVHVKGCFNCSSPHICVLDSWVCDGDLDCYDRSDESNCPNGCFDCTSVFGCIPQNWVCDGDSDCYDGSDELNCGFRTQTCYSCTTYTSSLVDINFAENTGTPGCDGPSYATISCTTGGCIEFDLTYNYRSLIHGSFSVEFEHRGCGFNYNYCLSDQELAALIKTEQHIARGAIQGSGLTSYHGGSGSACVCVGNLCNHAGRIDVNLAALVASLGLAYVMTPMY